ncbi:restriction endonuclease [uncultured Fibrella sp.]|uniref:restriction endonuclease n=1 Tax=uncultured Fibrella sp. TaxID=1284596 RepID=UPI0035CB448C
MSNRLSADGKALEKLVALIYETLKEYPGSEVIHDIKLDNILGTKSQFDVIIKAKFGFTTSMVAIECKDFGGPIEISKIHDFNGRCSIVKGITKKIFVAVNDYQRSAILMASKVANIELFDLKEISADTLFEWVLPASIKIGYASAWYLHGVSFHLKDKRCFKYDRKDIDARTLILCGPTDTVSIGQLFHNIIDAGGIENVKNFVSNEMSKDTWDTGTIKTKVSLFFNKGGEDFALILNDIIYFLESIELHLEIVHTIVSADSTIARQYKTTANEKSKSSNFASILSGRFKATDKLFDFDIIKSETNGKISVFYRDVNNKFSLLKNKSTTVKKSSKKPTRKRK